MLAGMDVLRHQGVLVLDQIRNVHVKIHQDGVRIQKEKPVVLLGLQHLVQHLHLAKGCMPRFLPTQDHSHHGHIIVSKLAGIGPVHHRRDIQHLPITLINPRGLCQQHVSTVSTLLSSIVVCSLVLVLFLLFLLWFGSSVMP